MFLLFKWISIRKLCVANKCGKLTLKDLEAINYSLIFFGSLFWLNSEENNHHLPMGCWILVLWYTTATEISESNRVALAVLASLMILVHWQGNNKQKCLLNYKFHWNHRGKVSVCQIEEDKTGMKGILCSSFSEGIRSAFLIVTERKLEWCHWTSRHCPAYAHTHTVTTYGSTSSKCIKLLQRLRGF